MRGDRAAKSWSKDDLAGTARKFSEHGFSKMIVSGGGAAGLAGWEWVLPEQVSSFSATTLTFP